MCPKSKGYPYSAVRLYRYVGPDIMEGGAGTHFVMILHAIGANESFVEGRMDNAW